MWDDVPMRVMVKSSPSIGYDNLTVAPSGQYFAFVHKTKVILVNGKCTSAKTDIQGKSVVARTSTDADVIHAKFVEVPAQGGFPATEVLVVGTTKSTYFMSPDGADTFFHEKHTPAAQSTNGSVNNFTRGICMVPAARVGEDEEISNATADTSLSVGCKHSCVAVGTSSGVVQFYRVSRKGEGATPGAVEFERAKTSRVSQVPITALASSANHQEYLVGCGDQDGVVRIYNTATWEILGEIAPSIPQMGPVTSLAFAPSNTVIVGYGNGQLRIYTRSGPILSAPVAKSWTLEDSGLTKDTYAVPRYELDGHFQAVSAVAVHPSRPIFATVSRDTAVRVWKVGSWEDMNLDLEFQSILEDCVMVGACWCGPSHSMLGVTTFDHDGIRFFSEG